MRPHGIESSTSHLHFQEGKTYEEIKQEMGEEGIKKVSEIRITTQVGSQCKNNNRFFSLFRFLNCSISSQFRTLLISKLNISISYSEYRIPLLVSVSRIRGCTSKPLYLMDFICTTLTSRGKKWLYLPTQIRFSEWRRTFHVSWFKGH